MNKKKFSSFLFAALVCVCLFATTAFAAPSDNKTVLTDRISGAAGYLESYVLDADNTTAASASNYKYLLLVLQADTNKEAELKDWFTTSLAACQTDPGYPVDYSGNFSLPYTLWAIEAAQELDMNPVDINGYDLVSLAAGQLSAMDAAAWDKIYITNTACVLTSLENLKATIPNCASYIAAAKNSILTKEGYEAWGSLSDTFINMPASDPDTLAMCIAALAPYYNTDAAVKQEVDKASAKLAAAINANGTFTAWGTESANSTGTVARAMAMLGTASLKNMKGSDGVNVLDALESFRNADTGAYTYSGKDNVAATYDALNALLAWNTYTYTVTFISTDGFPVSAQQVLYGQKPSALSAPTRMGYIFAGWYNGNTKYSFTAPATANLRLTAKWTPISYRITYNTNKGTLPKNAITSYNLTQSVALPTPVRKGYTFAGWYTNSSLTQKAASIKVGTTGNKTFYAKWTKVSTATVKATGLSNVKGKKAKLTWKKIKGVKGYRISYSTTKKFTKKTTKTVSVKANATKKTISKLKKGKTYYVRIRAYKLDSAGNKIYGKWSTVQRVTIRK